MCDAVWKAYKTALKAAHSVRVASDAHKVWRLGLARALLEL
jgi:hypothetical protein